MTHSKRAFENNVGKGENASYQHFLIFPQCFLPLNSLPNNKILDWSKLKASADDKINVAEMMISLTDKV